jgi:tetratricopeptide (TPR) repeat protein
MTGMMRPLLSVLRRLSSVVCLLGLFSAPAGAEPVRGEVTVSRNPGFARILFRLAEDVESDVRVANAVLVITFKKPVDIGVDRMNVGVGDYISAARRDPDGTGIRVALARKVTVNSMVAGERLFIDLLPEGWKGPPPGLPQDVVEDLNRRARDAENKIRQQRHLVQQRRQIPIRVRAAKHPTFTRFVFRLPDLIGVTTDRGDDSLTLKFDAPLTLDLSEAKAALPPMIEALDLDVDDDKTAVRFAFAGKAEVRTFREDGSYVLDISAASESAKEIAGPGGAIERKLAESDVAKSPDAKPAAADAKPTASDPMPAPGPVAEQPAARATVAPAAGEAPRAPAHIVRAPNAPVAVELHRQGDALRLLFPFAAPVPAAAFRRADTLWLVFDTDAPIDLGVVDNEVSRTIRSATAARSGQAQIVRIKLERPRLVSLGSDGTTWIAIIGDSIVEPTRALTINRNIVAPTRASAIIPFDDPRQLHRIADPDLGDTLLVATALGPPRGFLKTQHFVEFRALVSTHGVVIEPLADDLVAELTADKIVLGRPGGLTLSTAGEPRRRVGAATALMFDTQVWGADRAAVFSDRQTHLIRAAAEATEARRAEARLELARFYLARDMSVEAKAVLDVVLAEERPMPEATTAVALRAIANIMLDRPAQALRDLANPNIGNQYDAPLWRALAHARQGKWIEAREGFKNVETTLGTLPVELQRMALRDSVRAALEVRDIGAAANQLNEFEMLGVPRELEPSISVLAGRLAEGLGRPHEALAAYRAAAESWDRRAAAQGKLRETVLRYALGDLKRVEVIAELETLTTIWRGDETEIEALQLLARLYTEEGRYRDAFHVMRTALAAHPNSEMTRRIHDEATTTFDALFLAGKGDALPTIDALSLFYDYRELIPIGRRGDEMIRRLADRLVSVDLLDQASELLQYQVDHRLQGAARALVAIRLAVVYLFNHKPDRALAALRATRTADLSSELRNQRLLLEGRALSDLGRHDLALEVVAHVDGREGVRLRADIQWAARRWRESAEQIELLYGDRWRDWQPLSEPERSDILRAAIGYAMAEDPIGMTRFREKYAAKMAESADRRAFEVVSAPLGASSAEFRDIARVIAAIDTLDGFLRDMQKRYPETGIGPFAPAQPTPQGAEPANGSPSPAKKADLPNGGGRTASPRTATR